jgi:hypothetical protein
VVLLVALQILEHVLESGAVRIGVGMRRAGPGAEVALLGRVRERRRAQERLEVRRAAALRRAARWSLQLWRAESRCRSAIATILSCLCYKTFCITLGSSAPHPRLRAEARVHTGRHLPRC